MSVQNPLVRTVLVVKIFLEVTDASVNPDILDETVKLVSFVSLKNFIRNSHFHLAFISIELFNHFITKISPFLRSTSLHFEVRSPKYCLRIFNWVPLSFFIYMHFPIYSYWIPHNTITIVTFNNQGLDWGRHRKQFWQVKFPHQVIIRK